jgi:hypothetical protein
MKPALVPVRSEDQQIPRRYRGLRERLQRSAWTRAELCWGLRTPPHVPPLVTAVVWQKAPINAL